MLERQVNMRKLLKKAEERQPASLKARVLQAVFDKKEMEEGTPFYQEINDLASKVEALRERRGAALYNQSPSVQWPEYVAAIFNHPKIQFDNVSEYAGLTRWLSRDFPVRPVETWKPPRSNDAHTVTGSLFRHLFVRYEMPESLMRTVLLESAGEWQIDLFFHVAKGEGVHTFSQLPKHLKITSKGNFYFHHAPENFGLDAALNWAHLRQQGFPEHLASRLMAVRLIYGLYQPDWMPELKSFCERNQEMTAGKTAKVVRFLLQQNHEIGLPKVNIGVAKGAWTEVPVLYPGFSLKGRTWKSVLRHIETWERFVQNIKSLRRLVRFPEPSLKGLKWKSPGGLQILIVHLPTPAHLLEEGNVMRHCVGKHYQEACLHGHSSIWSVRILDKAQRPRRLATIEITRQKEIGEFAGKCNTGPCDLALRAVKTWGKAEGIELPEYMHKEQDD